jgi:hypothetical protein
MALTIKQIKDGAAALFNLKYWDAGSSNVVPAFVQIDPSTGDAAALIPQAVFTPRVITLNWTGSTSAATTGHIFADTELLANVAPANDVGCVLQSVTLLNKTFTAVALELHFFKASRSLGTEGASAVSISDAHALDHLGVVQIASSDWVSLVGSYVATKTGINLGMIPVSGSKDVYVGVVQRGSITWGATTDLQGIFTFL